MTQPALASEDDVAARLGRDLTDSEATRADALLADASAKVRGYTGQQITADSSTVRVRARSGRARLPQFPVTAVTAVKLVNDFNGAAVAAAPGSWRWDGVDILIGLSTPVINGPSYPYAPGDWSPIGLLEVTYTHGYDQTPDDLVGVVAGVVVRALSIQTAQAGMLSEKVDGYEYTVGPAAAAGGFGLLADEREVLDRYRRRRPASAISTW